MSVRKRHDLRQQAFNQPNPNPSPEPEPEPGPEPIPDGNTIVPQIVYYKDYTLKTDGLDNISITFESEEDKNKFELALLNRIWYKNETNLDYYSSHGYKWLYGINRDGQLTNVNVLLGITSLEVKGQPTKMYLFIYSFSQVTVRGILRIHQVILGSRNDYATVITENQINYGVYSFSQSGKPETPLLGFYKTVTSSVIDQRFYLPRYSFLLEGKHQDVIAPLLENYTGKFEIDFPDIKN